MNEQDFREDALLLIAEYFGEYTKELYVEFYAAQPAELISTSLQELLLEMLGPQKMRQVLSPVFKKYNLTL